MSLVKNTSNIRLGMIGLNKGNEHPYSWSAIFNGYNVRAMLELCPSESIPVYLGKEPRDKLRISGARVTHVYCNNRDDAEKVAECSLVDNIVDSPEELIGKVDAVIIGTDTGSDHLSMARPFVESGVPLFIDKPLCDNEADLETFKQWIKEDNKPIMSSSCFRYAKEFLPYRISTHELGDLRFISMTIGKKWETYGIHALEAIYPIAGPGFKTVRNTGTEERNIVHLTHSREIDIIIAVIKDLKYGGMQIVGSEGYVNVGFQDTFFAFKAQLQAFIDFLRTGRYPFPPEETFELIRLVAGAIQSRDHNGLAINLEAK